MKNAKRIIGFLFAIVLSFALIFSLASCDSYTTEETNSMIAEIKDAISKNKAELDAKIEVSGADYQELTRLLGEKEEAELVLMDLMEQWETAQESVES